MTQLSEHGARILAFLEHYQSEFQRSPTYREIGAAVGLASNDHVARDLRRLQQQGLISFTPGVSRSIVLTKKRSRQLALPVTSVGFKTARPARPALATDPWAQMAVGLFEDEKDVSVLRARGTAMDDAGVNDGDLVVVKRTASFKSGELAAVWIHRLAKTTLRYMYRGEGRLRLQPADPNLPAEYVENQDIEIRGIVLAIIRKK